MIEHTPLDPALLSPAAIKALGAGPGRMMAARGLLPLPPADQVAVLYELSLDRDSGISNAARTTAAGLPEKLLAGTLANPTLDPRVLDMFGQLVADKPALFDVIAQNPTTADETMASLAERVGPREIDLIAANEQRLLRHPQIIAAMYLNRRARMSTVDRVVELAVRNQVRVPGLAAWDEVARALQATQPVSAPEVDVLFEHNVERLSGDDSALTAGDAEAIAAEALAADADVAELETQQLNKMSLPSKIRLATLGNAFARAALIRDPVKLVALATIKSPGVTDVEAVRYASNANLGEDIIRYIATNRSWTKLYSVKLALLRNPKTPIPDAARLLPFLRERDLRTLSQSRGVSSALVAQAKKLMSTRGNNK